jgi:hypothetical protein
MNCDTDLHSVQATSELADLTGSDRSIDRTVEAQMELEAGYASLEAKRTFLRPHHEAFMQEARRLREIETLILGLKKQTEEPVI